MAIFQPNVRGGVKRFLFSDVIRMRKISDWKKERTLSHCISLSLSLSLIEAPTLSLSGKDLYHLSNKNVYLSNANPHHPHTRIQCDQILD